jgi:pimeloyl-ACP methyl ester carboxylesterase
LTATRTPTPERPFGSVQPGPEPTRARYPHASGYVERDGERVFWERYGDGEPTLLYITTPWPIAHSRIWRAQIPYFARHHRVVCFDPRGNGRSDRPRDPAAYALSEVAADAVDVLAASGTDRAVIVTGARGAQPALRLAADHPDRVAGLFLMGPQPRNQRQMVEPMMKGRLDRYEGWDKFNPEYWREDFHGFVEWFAAENFPEPHHSRIKESFIEYALETDADTLIAASLAGGIRKAELPEVAQRIRCPAFVVCGEDDTINPPELSREVADLLGAPFVVVPETGHGFARGAVRVILLLREFIRSIDGR